MQDWKIRDKIQIEITAGTHIKSACDTAISTAKLQGREVAFDFNGIKITATPESSSRELENYFHSECDARQKAYASSPEGIAAKEKCAAEIVQKQSDVDGYTKSLPVVLASNNLAAVVGWLRMFADVADDVAVKINHRRIYRIFEKSGFIANDYVGSNQYLNERFFSFNRKNRLGRYLIGQAMSCLKSKMPPHPGLTEKFCAEYFTTVKS